MKLIDFPERNVIYAKDQPQYQLLPAYKYSDNTGTILCLWKLSVIERLQILFTGKIWHSILTFDKSLQPQLLSTTKPAIDNDQINV